LVVTFCVISGFSVDPNGPVPDDTSITAAGGRPTEYLELAKKGGGHSGMRTFCLSL